MRVCFVLGRLGPSGGVRTVMTHAQGLASAHGMDVAIAVTDETGAQPADGVDVIPLEDAGRREFDVAVATWWRTVYSLFRIPARRRAWFMQNFEERLYRPGDVERLGAVVARGLPVAFVTEARWIAEQLREVRPDAPRFHVPNGIDKTLFDPSDARPERQPGPLRVLVEGSPELWFKGVPDAIRALSAMRQPHHATLVTPEQPPAETAAAFDAVVGPLAHEEMPARYAEADVLLKLSRVEGVFTPPLEAFHCGTTAVVWPVTGHDEYVEHGVNAIVAGWDDIAGTARWLDLLASDEELLARLRGGALDTARAWPSWEDSTAAMAAALTEIADSPRHDAAAGVQGLLDETHVAMEELRLDKLRLTRELERNADELTAERQARTAAESRSATLERELASTLGARARRLLASRRR